MLQSLSPIDHPAHRPAAEAHRTGPLRLSCIVPCWNEAANLAQLIPLLRSLLAELADESELILVDDGSTDDSAALLSDWAAQPGVRVLEFSRNFGKEAALTAGLQAAAGDVMVMLDADLQHPPELIASMLDHWRRGADVVYAVRENRDDESAFKRLGARWFYRLMNAADRFEVPPGGGDFRLLDRVAVDALLAMPERNRFMKGLYAWVGFDAVAIPYTPSARAHGTTSFKPLQLIRLSIDGLTAFTTWPLRAVSVTGLVLAFFAFAYGLFLVLRYALYGNEVSGWTTIVVSLLLFLGVQLVSIGILGEYIGRIFEEVKARPLYIVKRERGQGLKARRP